MNDVTVIHHMRPVGGNFADLIVVADEGVQLGSCPHGEWKLLQVIV